ncbi:MAG: hypothetical protein EXS31_00355 [Pedosphaera sp.]|nr:hypothetical protein [Pedosphaera sp.]
MNQREKILAAAVGGIVFIFIVGFGIRGVILKPVSEIDKRSAAIREKLDKIKAERRAYFDAEDRMKAHTLRTFADTVDQASARSGELLTKQILASGLQEAEFTRLPVGPRKLRGAQELGWSIQGDGPLADVTDLIFMLQTSPYLHRIENLSVSTGDAPGIVRVRFRYLTLVPEPAPEVQRKELASTLTLESAERHIFDGIVSRDILRPYIKRTPPPSPESTSSSSSPSTKAGSAQGPEAFRIVSLSEWQGEPEIHVRDQAHQTTKRYKAGDQLAGGTVVCVDYRSMPMPGNEGLRSDSRVIVKIGSEFFAIERGKTLADKRKLTSEQLPTELAKVK